ncbi:MAG: ribbon-helix-helix domain-containing protein [Alphaproteobacteria bacterium]|nr:ribbon-helix-helix domain-containing protein [Alphaproteobacteria bacterium]
MKKISLSLSGHQTSITIEDEFAAELRAIATRRNTSVAAIVSDIDDTRGADTNLSSAVRVWILNAVKSE